jgi:hypothetical protein
MARKEAKQMRFANERCRGDACVARWPEGPQWFHQTWAVGLWATGRRLRRPYDMGVAGHVIP